MFLSYARGDDEPFVERLADALGAAGADVWWDRRDMPSRSLSFLEEIRRAIDRRERMVAVLGPAAVTSDYVRCEWQYALSRTKVVVPVLRLGDYDLLPSELRNLHCPDCRASRSWDEALAEILRVLREPLPQLGMVVGLPSLPPHFQPRADTLSRLAATVLIDQRAPVNPERWARVTLLSGMGGMGKSVMASALARSLETRRAFRDGVFWLDLRRVVGTETAPEALLELVASGKPAEPGEQPVQLRLATALRDRRCLLILDNASRVSELEAIVAAMPETARMLITTRDRELVGEAHRVDLGGLSEQAAREHLADWIERPPTALDLDCDAVLRACEGLPFAIALCGSLIASGVSARAVADKLQAADLDSLQKRFPDYPYPGVLSCLEVSVHTLQTADPRALACFEQLAIFPAGAMIPTDTFTLLWRHTLGLDDADCALLVARLVAHSLLRDEPGRVRRASLHQLVHAYLAQRVPDRTALHEHLLQAYAARSSADLVDGPDDGYYYEHLVHHLLQARGPAPVCALLTRSPAWMNRKRQLRGSVLSFISDAQRTIAALAETIPEEIVALARLAAAVHTTRGGARSTGPAVLRAMLRCGLDEQALAAARANSDAQNRIAQLFEIEGFLHGLQRPRVELLDEIEQLIPGLPPDRRAVSLRATLMRRRTDAGQLDRALELWRALSAEDKAAAHLEGGRLAVALQRAGQADAHGEVERNLPRSDLTLHRVARATSRADRRAALRDALIIEDSIMRDVALRQLTANIAASGDIVLARSVAARVQRSQARLSALLAVGTAACIEEAVSVAETLEGGGRVLALIECASAIDQWLERQHRASLWARISAWLRGEWAFDGPAKARALFTRAEAEIATLEPNRRVLLQRVLASSAWHRRAGRRAELLEAARSSALSIEDPRERAEKLAELVLDLAGDDPALPVPEAAREALQQALALNESTTLASARARALVGLSEVLTHSGRFDLAVALVREISDEHDRRTALRGLAALAAHRGHHEGVCAIARIDPSDRQLVDAQRVALARTGRFDEALRQGPIEEDPIPKDVIREIAHALAEQGQLARAIELLDRLGTDDVGANLRARALTSMAGTLPADSADAAALIDKAEAAAAAIASPAHRAAALSGLAAARARLRQEARARELFEQSITAAGEIDDDAFLTLLDAPVSVRVFGEIGVQLIASGYCDRALQLCRSFEPKAEKGWLAVRAILIATAAAALDGPAGARSPRADALFDEARRLATQTENEIVGPSWQAGALLRLAECLMRAGRFKAAFDALSQAHLSADLFIAGVAHWYPHAERHHTGLGRALVVAVCEVCGWQRADWAAFAAQLTASGS